jgi:phosphoglycolate phosphatase
MTAPTFVFDLDGTLVDTAPDLVGGLNVALALENLEPILIRDVHKLIGGGVRLMLTRGLDLRGHSVSPERFEELASTFFAHYELHIADESTLYPDVVPVLDELAASGNILAVCTNKPERLSLLLLEALGLRSRFAAICGADTFPARKPDPIHLIGTIERAGGKVGRSVMIGDSRTDRDAARNADVPCVLLDYGYTDVPVGELDAEAVVSRFAAVPDAARKLLSELKRA